MLSLGKKALWALLIKFLYFLYFRIVVILHMRLKFTTMDMISISSCHCTMYISMWTFTYACEHYISLWTYFPCEHPCGNSGAHHRKHHCTFSLWTSHVWFFCRLVWSLLIIFNCCFISINAFNMTII